MSGSLLKRKRERLNYGFVGDWTDIDAKIILAIAHRIKANTIKRTGAEISTVVGSDYPRFVYKPSQKWTASLNL